MADLEKLMRLPYGYEDWIKDNEPDAAALEDQRARSEGFAYRPKISVIVPVYCPPVHFLEEMFASLQAQTYEHWELCLANGSADDEQVRNCIREYAGRDARIRCVDLERNLGISGNSNRALDIATGEYLALLDQDDTLSPFALHEIVSYLQENRAADVIYSDHDYVSADGAHRLYPFFKPDWSPELMLSANYITHLTVLRSELVRSVGGFQPDLDGAQDWDLFFRVAEKTRQIAHIPKVLYHWRESASSSANNPKAKPYVHEAQIKTICRHLDAMGLQAVTAEFDAHQQIHVKWPVEPGKVSIIVLTKGSNRLLENCVASILHKSRYPNYEILLINNGPKRMGEFDFFHRIVQTPNVRVLDYEGDFNYSKLNNFGAAQCDGEYLLFLNNDTEVISEDWLDELVMWASWSPVGAVGAKLLLPNGLIQHAGAIVGLGGTAGHVFAGCEEPCEGIFGNSDWYRDYSALTAACLMLRREVFERIGQFNEEFELNGGDVELGLRLNRAGLRLVYNPYARLMHVESATHMGKIPPNDFKASFVHYKGVLATGDPYFNPNLCHWNNLPTYRRKRELRPLDAMRDQVEMATAAAARHNPASDYSYAREAPNLVTWLDANHEEIKASKELHRKYAGKLDIQSVTWMIPEFENAYYGGIYTILRFASFLTTRKHVKNRFLVVGSMNTRPIAERIRAAFPSLSTAEVSGIRLGDDWSSLESSDALVSTLWSTAYFAVKFNATRRKFYFLQDYEPLFYPAGSTFGLVEATYRFGFYGLGNTPTLQKLYEEQYGGIATSFIPAVDTGMFFPNPDNPAPGRGRRPYTLFFYGRPGAFRNAFELGAGALRMLKKRLGSDVIILSAGAEWSPYDYDLDGVVTNMGLLTLRQTAGLYRNCDAGLVMMFTKHPSYLPFELMASGCLTVTNKNQATEWLLKDGENCLLTEPTASCIAETLERGLVDEAGRERIVRNAHALVQDQYSNWDDQFEKLYEFMGAPKDGTAAR